VFVTNQCWTFPSQQKRYNRDPKQRIHNKTERHTHFTNAFNVSIYCRYKSAVQKPIVQHNTLPAVGHDFLVGLYFTACHVSVFWQSQLFFGTPESPISYSVFKGCTSSSQLLTSSGIHPASQQVVVTNKNHKVSCLLFEIWTQGIHYMKRRTLSTDTYDQTISWVADFARNKFIRVLISECLISCTWYLQLNEIKHLLGPDAVSFLSNRAFSLGNSRRNLPEPACILPRTAKT